MYEYNTVLVVANAILRLVASVASKTRRRKYSSLQSQ